MKAILFGIITVLGSCTEIREEVNPEGPWYSEVSLTVNPSLRSDMYMCSNYHKHTVGEAFKLKQQKHTVNSGPHPFGPRPKVPYYKTRKTGEDGWTRHNVPIICGTRGGQCGVIDCDCICHKK